MTLTRLALVVGVAVLAVTGTGAPWLVGLASVALALDLVDGHVARRTGTASPRGARFDMEVDALLVLVLSCHVALELDAPWVLLIGLARYLKSLAGLAWPWLRGTAPPRRWAKVVAAVQGVVLTVASADLLPRPVVIAALVVAAVLLAESFATEARWLSRDRASAPARSRARSWIVTGVAAALVVAALTMPSTLEALRPAAVARLPVELVAYLALVLLLPAGLGRLRAGVAWVAGLALGGLALLKVLDLGFRAALDRPFDPLVDWRHAGSTVDLVRDSTGEALGTVLLLLAGATGLALLVLTPLAVRRLTHTTVRHRATSARVVVALATIWAGLSLVDVRAYDGTPLASAATATYAYGQVARVPSELREQRAFVAAAARDPMADVPAEDLLTGLRGKDVLVVFVESYGRVALEEAPHTEGIEQVLSSGTARLGAAGFESRSAYLTSPTFGALSWLAHATLQTGLWTDSQHRYDVLMRSRRLTLSGLFERAGWRTVADVPANTEDWPQASFYGFDHVYDSRNVGYEGPRFGYPTMPDQFTLEAFWRLELADADRRPVMAEIDLISSHAPWSRTPWLIDRELVGDGSAFRGMPEQLPSEPEIWTSPERIRRAYGRAVEYSLSSVIDFLLAHGDDDLVVVMLGDHQPATVVSGSEAGRDVPVSVITRDDDVLDRIEDWGWGAGLEPATDAPVWGMDSFRDAFLTAYGPGRAHNGRAEPGGAQRKVNR